MAKGKREIGIRFYGGAREIGGSCIELSLPDGRRVLLDCGGKFKKDGRTVYPEIEKPEKIDIAFLSHPHADHSLGFLHARQIGLNCPIITTEMTKQTSVVTFCDAHKLEVEREEEPRFTYGKIAQVLNLMKTDRSRGQFEGLSYKLFPAGHIPGAVAAYLGYGHKSILYTGDINNNETRLVAERGKLPHADVLIIDCTYGNRLHPDREKTEQDFRQMIEGTVAGNGCVVIGAFAVARSPEILLLLTEINPDCPIYVDGMPRDIVKVYLENIQYLKNRDLEKIRGQVRFVSGSNHRRYVANMRPAIVVASGGMLNGGAILHYAKAVAPDEKSVLALTGYQVEGTNGRRALEEGRIEINGEVIDLKCSVRRFSFSTHLDSDGIKKTIVEVMPKLVIAQHGDEQSVRAVVKMARNLNIKAIAPAIGERIIV